MGQKSGKAIFREETKAFVNISTFAVESLREIFFEECICMKGGFILDINKAKYILSSLQTEMGIDINGKQKHEDTDMTIEKLFRILDTQKQGLIDALELLTLLGFISTTMNGREKYDFIFRCYDFNDRNCLVADQVLLAIKNVAVGLHKVTIQLDNMERFGSVPGNLLPKSGVVLLEEDFEGLVEGIMQKYQSVNDPNENYESKYELRKKVPIEHIVKCCMNNHECRNWLEHFSPKV